MAMLRVAPPASWLLFDVRATRRLEEAALDRLPAHTLMRRAGLSAAKLALALAPHARTIWVAAGPGNNGGDGLEAALHLHAWEKNVVVTWLGNTETSSPDTAAAWQRAQSAGVIFASEPPERFDLCLDALLGIGASRAPEGLMAQWIQHMGHGARVLSIDVPTGLNADTGEVAGGSVRAWATLCLLTLKPGLFTAEGRDAAGQVWLDDLESATSGDTQAPIAAPCALLAGKPAPRARVHASHKGSYGDVAVVGGAPGMGGAAILAATAALHRGTGRVFVALLDANAPTLDNAQPELMLRTVDRLDLAAMTVVCGCGGGEAVRAHLPRILSSAASLVLDADALNLIALDAQLQTLLAARSRRAWRTVLTPHPLEAARLLGGASHGVQKDRLAAASRLAHLFQCTVVLKGSGTVIAAPSRIPCVNPTGNARLASAGTGDVLAGMLGAGLAAGAAEFEAACEAAFVHGQCADEWPAGQALTASRLARSLRS